MWRALHTAIFGASTQNAPVPKKKDQLDGPPAPWRTRAATQTGPHGFVAVVGESHYQETLRRLSDGFELLGRTERTFTATLAPEPTNPHDPNAVVVTTADGTTIGYLAREMAQTFPKRVLKCPAQLCGGEDGKSIGVVLDFASMPELDPHGQPFNVLFNRAGRTERDLSELLGLAKGMLADGVVTEDEAQYLRTWQKNHPESRTAWPTRPIFERLERHFKDGYIDADERDDLQAVLASLVGGTASVLFGDEPATLLPLDTPVPPIGWGPDQVYVFTGRFAYGTRAACEREATSRDSTCERNVTRRTTFLVIGTFGSRDWKHSSFGRKIQRAVELKESGSNVRIVCEKHWATALSEGV